MLRKWTPRDKYQIFQISKFPGTLSFVINPGMFWRNLTKINQIYIPYKFVQSSCIPPKIKCEIFQLIKVRRQLAPPQTNWTLRPLGHQDDQDFPGKVTHCRHVFFFFFSIAHYSVEDNDTMAFFMLETLKWFKKLKSSRDDFNVLDHFNVSSIKMANNE